MENIIKAGTPFHIITKKGNREDYVLAKDYFFGNSRLWAENPKCNGRDIEFYADRAIFGGSIESPLTMRVKDELEASSKLFAEYLKEISEKKEADKRFIEGFLDAEGYKVKSDKKEISLQNGTHHRYILMVLLDANNVDYYMKSKYGCDTEVFGKVPKMKVVKDNGCITFDIGYDIIIEIPDYWVKMIRLKLGIDFNKIISYTTKDRPTVGVFDYGLLTRFLKNKNQ